MGKKGGRAESMKVVIEALKDNKEFDAVKWYEHKIIHLTVQNQPEDKLS